MRNKKIAIILIFIIIGYGAHIMFDDRKPIYDWELLEIQSRSIRYKAEHEQFNQILEEQKAITQRMIDSANIAETINFLRDSTENH